MSTAEFHAFESYPYDQDAEYRLGLNSILQHAQDEVHAQQLEKQARCFYFKRCVCFSPPQVLVLTLTA